MPARQVRDGVVLAIAVLVEPAVGVVEQQALPVGVPEAFVPARDLIEGGGVLEGEAAPRQLRAPFAPYVAGCAEVPLVHQHQVVLAEVAHRDALDALPLRQLVEVDDLDRGGTGPDRHRSRRYGRGGRFRGGRARAGPTSARSGSAE